MIFSYSSSGLQTQLDILSDFCIQRGLTMNVKKTKTIVKRKFLPIKDVVYILLFARPLRIRREERIYSVQRSHQG